MTTETNVPSVESLEYVVYIDDTGELPEQFQGQIGVYAIFDQEKILRFVGYSRDVYLSLKQHLVRQPEQCYWVKVQTIERPNRTLLENIENAWIAENGSLDLKNVEIKDKWTNPINTQALMTSEEKTNYQNPLIDDLAKMKLIKNVARRVETEILAVLAARGLKTQIRFNPKLKEEGLLDLK
ncbi:GIY-YIG nuclease family protein [Sphaerospermopsis aphanizomenoides BCCUSP55]|uniref:GIY-YIG nuclease family protein n=1 Tax=Sphaerospermopsis aphanizomenoides TaxID=459663 RepID=UPI001906645F|nr:GIY-YIG nuclease family protein [Sphaerospermopsis aphanizomenoides]MBK1990360.1 GIY-YIG nuclease family protein [Sphaerospermopsis aphanizomenoides BCCUSP55]